MPSSPVLPAGQAHAAIAPATLDLAERAALAIRGMLNTLDPALMTMYGLAHFTTNPPVLRHWSADIPLDPKLGESLPLMRLMCGSDYAAKLEEDYRAEMLSRIDDGLYWDRYTPARPWRNIYNNSADLYGQGRDEDFASVWGVARMVRALAAWHGVNADPNTAQRAALIRGLRRIAVDRDDYSYYPHKGGWHDGFVYPRTGWIDTSEARQDREGPEGSITCAQGHQVYAAAQLYAMTGDPVARELATRLARYLMKPRFWGGTVVVDPTHPTAFNLTPLAGDAPFRDGSQHGHWPLHFHARAIVLRGLLYYATTCGDERTLEFVRRGYEFTQTQGIPRMGWINTHPPAIGCEGCALGDLIGLGIRLTDAGAGDYWDDVDAVVRNQLAEQQITDGAALAAFCARQPAFTSAPAYPPPFESTEDVVNRSVGVFFGITRPGFVTDPWVMHCCTGNASQGLYYAWEGALREDGAAAVVNLLLNRAGRLVDVHSHLPHAGLVTLVVKQPCRASIRVPRWVDLRQATVHVNGSRREPERLGRYLSVRDLVPGDTVAVAFPVTENTATYVINKGTPIEETYACTFRGSTLVELRGGPAPRANDFPLYRDRDRLRIAEAPQRSTTRFVADRTFTAW